MDTDPLKLRSLPPLQPPDNLWPALERALDARQSPRSPRRWVPLAAAACVAMLALGILRLAPQEQEAPVPRQAGAGESLQRLQAVSAALETQLGDYRDGVLSAATADSIARMERELAWLDTQLGEQPEDPALWAERVALLGGMVQRYLREDWRAEVMLASY